MELRSTLNLPDAKSTIPMKANLPVLEPSILAEWNAQNLYHQIQQDRVGAPTFVLHDGPPYTNSPIHLGTAMNKVLKDFVVKSRTMMGFRAPYVPGYDNHGLPIELAVQKKFADRKLKPTRDELLAACREHATEYIQVQTKQFQRLGVLGHWERPYATMDPRYEAELVRTFARLHERGLIYRGLRPTLWSPTSQTALADTEILYQDHVSKAIYVRFALQDDPNQLLAEFDHVYTIIWTTTPWTIPANLAVAFHPEFEYSVVRVPAGVGSGGHVHYVVLNDLAPMLAVKLGWPEDWEIVQTFEGINFDRMVFRHPIFDRDSLAVMANYVTGDDGTGVVHTAPSHGRDDFFTGQRYGLGVPNTVDGRGVLTEETGEFAGTYYKDCDTVVVQRLAEVGALLRADDYEHSYPHAERDGKPVIFRATEQWFIAIDPIRDDMLAVIPDVDWVPAVGQNRIEAMVRNRPDWCISRQRPWGVGIPVFYGKQSGVPVYDPVAFEAVAEAVETEGSQVWFQRTAAEILPAGYVHPETGETEFEKETDVLDVWFDSGASHLAALEGRLYPEWGTSWPADVYLEGSDQHRGWFNSSLILAMACKGAAPYRHVITHGFVTDSQGRKMSKRLGNVIDPVQVCATNGADILRYWTASVDWHADAPCSDDILRQAGDSYRNVRNTLRFLLSNAVGITDVASKSASEGNWGDLDAWITGQVDLLVADSVAAYERFDFGAVVHGVHQFCREELSRFYLDVIKDRMYCDGADWASRRSGQLACRHVLIALVKLIAPILPFTAEETWTKMRELGVIDEPRSIHRLTFDAPSEDRLAEIEASDLQVRVAALRQVRESVQAAFEAYKGTDGVKDSQDAVVALTVADEVASALNAVATADLANLFRVSWVTVSAGSDAIAFAPSPYAECQRSRLRRPDVAEAVWNGETILLSARDRQVLGV
ncbi:MAG: isoleucine--tRNA ligase [Fimbriimonadaceae bacterium]|nr:isoleucine--tRNA ligase [Fimbriimonadaceae bacterium]